MQFAIRNVNSIDDALQKRVYLPPKTMGCWATSLRFGRHFALGVVATPFRVVPFDFAVKTV